MMESIKKLREWLHEDAYEHPEMMALIDEIEREIAEKYVKLHDAEHGTLTAEQVSKATYAHSIHADCADADWQAIADYLNDELGSTVRIGAVKTLPEYERADKAQAVKVLEEAAELFAAWQDYDSALENNESTECQTRKKVAFLYECADAIIAICHLLAGLDVVNVEDIIADKLRVVESRTSSEIGMA